MKLKESPDESGYERFEDFGLNDYLLHGLREAGFKVPSPIQKKSIPHILAGRDIIGQAQTGTGKTAAFGLSAMNRLKNNVGVEILVITPTRELASQVSDELYKLGKFANVRTVAVYGGQSISRQVNLISNGAQVVVATPGRLLDHLKSRRFSNFNPSIIILDEADEMLDMGFLDDIKKIFTFLPKKRQTLLFSATLPEEIKRLANRILNKPVSIKINAETATPLGIDQRYYVINEKERIDAIIRLIDSENPEKSIIFCRTKKETDNLNTTLISRGISSFALHGDMDQNQRIETFRKFQKGMIDTLVATDVAARGIDISGVTHVFNYHIPLHPDSYVHRIGRTGRAGEKGIAITLVTPLEFKELKRIMHVTRATIAHNNMPTLKDIKLKSHLKLVKEISKVHENYKNEFLIRLLEEEFSLSQVLNKLITFIVNQQNFSGPEEIGFTKNEIKTRLLKTETSRNRHKKTNYRYKKSKIQTSGPERKNPRAKSFRPPKV